MYSSHRLHSSQIQPNTIRPDIQQRHRQMHYIRDNIWSMLVFKTSSVSLLCTVYNYRNFLSIMAPWENANVFRVNACVELHTRRKLCRSMMRKHWMWWTKKNPLLITNRYNRTRGLIQSDAVQRSAYFSDIIIEWDEVLMNIRVLFKPSIPLTIAEFVQVIAVLTGYWQSLSSYKSMTASNVHEQNKIEVNRYFNSNILNSSKMPGKVARDPSKQQLSLYLYSTHKNTRSFVSFSVCSQELNIL